MLCLQNIGNLYRKNAFKILANKETEALPNVTTDDALAVFDESIDFSLEAGVPDPVPFEQKLRSMLVKQEKFLLPEQHKLGHR